MVCVGVMSVLWLLKEGLAWAIDKRLQVINKLDSHATNAVKALKNKAFKTWVAMWSLVVYSNYFEI